MKVRDLLNDLIDCDPEAIVVIEGSGHTYRPLVFSQTIAGVEDGYNEYSEFRLGLNDYSESIPLVVME